MYIMGALKVNESTAKKNLDDIKRHRSCYFFNGAEICVAAFLVIYDIGEDMLKSINNMLCSMESHPMRNSERRAPPRNAFEFDEYKMVKTFITTCAEYYGLPNQQPWEEEIRTRPYTLPLHTPRSTCVGYTKKLHMRNLLAHLSFMICEKICPPSEFAPHKWCLL